MVAANVHEDVKSLRHGKVRKRVTKSNDMVIRRIVVDDDELRPSNSGLSVMSADNRRQGQIVHAHHFATMSSSLVDY